jgi:hypothetical protein
VRAPFLGGTPGGKDVPANLQNDYLEMQRAYKAAFAFWLQTKATGASGEASSASLFAKLLTSAGTDADVGAIYGVPLTAADASADSLEMRFLRWLAKS